MPLLVAALTGPPTEAAAASILITIDKTAQKMSVWVDGVQQYDWPVSTGRPGYATPSGTYTPTSMNEVWYSKEWDNSPMPHSIFFMKDGHAIHGSHEVKNLGKAASHGCVRLSPENAATLYQLVEAEGMDNTQVVVQGDDAGVAQGEKPSKRTRPRYDDDYGDNYAEQPPPPYGWRRQPWWAPDYAPRRRPPWWYNQRPY